MKNQICDNNFDCADLSDEHGCNLFYSVNSGDLIVDVTKNISCLIKCDNKCIPHDKLCNHITDCGDGRDEIGCKHMSFCFSETMLKCFSDSICYELHRKCDGFNDCLDRTDETYCESISDQLIFRTRHMLKN
ncbi:hypothetical protein HZS_3065 [Henneguya salminicola]|nr:hypothetical protein HZS_3065 [Henneguya salminicola]